MRILTTERILYIAGVIVLVLFLVDSCNTNKQLANEAIGYSNYKDTVVFYKSRSGKLLASNDALQISESALLELNDNLNQDLEDARIKNLNSFTRVRTQTRIDTLEIRLTDSIPCDSFEVRFVKLNQWYRLGGRINNTRLFIDSLTIPNEQKIIVGQKKNGFLKPKSFTVVVDNSNPYMIVTGLTNYTIDNKKPWYSKWYIKVAAGFALGYVATK